MTAEAFLTADFMISEGAHLPMAGCWHGSGALRALCDVAFATVTIETLDLQDIAVGESHAIYVLDMVLAGTLPTRVKRRELFRFRGDKVGEIRPYYVDPTVLIEQARPKSLPR